jgi:hypothetical protein
VAEPEEELASKKDSDSDSDSESAYRNVIDMTRKVSDDKPTLRDEKTIKIRGPSGGTLIRGPSAGKLDEQSSKGKIIKIRGGTFDEQSSTHSAKTINIRGASGGTLRKPVDPFIKETWFDDITTDREKKSSHFDGGEFEKALER